MSSVPDITISELRDHVSRLRAELEDVQEERAFVLGQTGLHVSARSVSNYESEISRLKAEIDEAEQVLRSMSSD